MTVSNQAGTLYVVATPIGNLEDLSARAVRILGEVAVVAAEDTRHTRKLFAHYGLKTPLLSLHEHNEAGRVGLIRARLQSGQSVALVSDAGTPLISDPGYPLVRELTGAGLQVSPIPGPSAAIAALSVSGLPTDRFCFEGFLPARDAARRARLDALRDEPRTMVFYESGRRIVSTVAQCRKVFGAERPACIARELSKRFESVKTLDLPALLEWLQASADNCRGEFVLIVGGQPHTGGGDTARVRDSLRYLVPELGVKRAAVLASRLHAIKRSEAYGIAMAVQAESAAQPDGPV